jgi:hypothetical protein
VGGSLPSTLKEKPLRVKVSPMDKVSMRFRLSETPKYPRAFSASIDICIPFNRFDHSVFTYFCDKENVSESSRLWEIDQTPSTPAGFVNFKCGLHPGWSPGAKALLPNLEASPMYKGGAPRFRVEDSG